MGRPVWSVGSSVRTGGFVSPGLWDGLYLGTEKLEIGNQLEMPILGPESTGEPRLTTGSPVTEAHAAPPVRNLWD